MWFVLLTCVGTVHGQLWTDPVDTTQGRIRGLMADDGDYSMYLGIPYAKVNETNPFGVPLAPPQFEGVFNAIDDSAICPQEEEFENQIVGTLDCLHINIYVPNIKQRKIPVLVYIYGGGFNIGFAGRYMYGPKYLVRHNIILITFNYRLGPYGFMCLDTEEIPGNQGLKDQYLALKWIKENIASFGGDADKITIMGESAGSISIDFHLTSDYPKLYHQAILQSGTGLVSNVFVPSDKSVPIKLAKHLGYATNDSIQALLFLATVHTDLVIAATLDLNIKLSVCIEKEFDNNKRIIKEHSEFLNMTDVYDMPVLIGFNKYESGMVNNFENELFHNMISKVYNIDKLDDMINKVRRFYIADEIISNKMAKELIDFRSDVQFNYPIQRSITRYIEGGARIYQYMYTYSGNRDFLQTINNISLDGAVHADELGYLFDMRIFPETPTKEDQLVIDRITTLWTNFVKYGNPTPTVSPLIPITWPQVTADTVPYLIIGSNLTLSSRPYHARLTFWELFHYANRDKLQAWTA